MQNIKAYSINHVNLHQATNNIFFDLENDRQYYLVFWWRSLAIGDLYIEDYNGNQLELKQALLNAIKPAIKSYNLSETFISQIQQHFLDENFSAFFELMNKGFQPYILENLPKQVEVSVIICTRNRPAHLTLCLQSLLSQACLPAEIIVIDNAPADNTTEEVSKNYGLVSYYIEPRPGLDYARNTGVQKAKFPIVAFVDDDVKVHQDWCYRIWETFLDEKIAATTGLIVALSLETESQQIFEKHWGFNKGYKAILFDNKFIREKPPRVWDIGAGANMAFRKTAIEEAGYFDERLGAGASGCGDDSEMWYRILLKGHTIKYNPKAISFHDHRKDLPSLHKQLFSYMRGHVAAALFQHKTDVTSGYKKYIFYDTPKYYLLLIRMGFPFFKFRYRTLWSEIKGIISGIKYYYKNKSVPRISK